MTPTVGSTVRIVICIGTAARAVYASVLSVAPILPENLGTHGEPTIAVACLDDPSALALTKVDWHQELDRYVGVPHVSHPDAVAGRVSVAWVDVLETAGEELDMSDFNPAQFFPKAASTEVATVAETAPVPALPVTPVQLPPVVAQAEIEGVIGAVPISSEVLVGKEFVTLDKLKVGDHIVELGLTVTTVSNGDDGTLYIGTEKYVATVVPAAPSATDTVVAATVAETVPAAAAPVAAVPVPVEGEVIQPV